MAICLCNSEETKGLFRHSRLKNPCDLRDGRFKNSFRALSVG